MVKTPNPPFKRRCEPMSGDPVKPAEQAAAQCHLARPVPTWRCRVRYFEPRAADAPARAGGRSNAEISVKDLSDRLEAPRTASRVPWDCSDPISSLTVHAFPFHIGGVTMSSL